LFKVGSLFKFAPNLSMIYSDYDVHLHDEILTNQTEKSAL
jgi:hypothetical protein